MIKIVLKLLSWLLATLKDKRTLERPSPRDIIKYNQISWTVDTLTIKDIPSITIANIADTNSMDGLFDIGHNALLISAFDRGKLAVGDIIVYRPDDNVGQIIHRIIEIGEDDLGKFYRAKGDNNYREDIYIIRNDHISYLCIGIIY